MGWREYFFHFNHLVVITSWCSQHLHISAKYKQLSSTCFSIRGKSCMVLICHAKITMWKVSNIDSVMRFFGYHRKSWHYLLWLPEQCSNNCRKSTAFSLILAFLLFLWPCGHPGKLQIYWSVCKLHFCTKEAFFACVHLFKGAAARMEEGRSCYLGHSVVNTEYPHLLIRDLSEAEFSSEVTEAAEHTKTRKTETERQLKQEIYNI